jgi:hypothetical protein
MGSGSGQAVTRSRTGWHLNTGMGWVVIGMETSTFEEVRS